MTLYVVYKYLGHSGPNQHNKRIDDPLQIWMKCQILVSYVVWLPYYGHRKIQFFDKFRCTHLTKAYNKFPDGRNMEAIQHV